jgi:NADH dehydrogenase
MKQICILGGSGFVGTALTQQLSVAGYEVKVLTRRRESSKHLILIPNVNVVECNVMNDIQLQENLKGAYAVINLIGVLHESKKFSFQRMHHDLPQRILKFCTKLGINRMIQMSALQASEHAPSQYLKSKGLGEKFLLGQSKKINVTIIRPSIIFGRGDSFINLFAKLIKFLPVILLAKPNAKFQPIYVENVASAFVEAIDNPITYGKSFDLAGPTAYTFREIIQYVAKVLNKKRLVIGLNDVLSYCQAFLMELMPIKLMTRDNLKSMSVESVSNKPFPAYLSFKPVAMEAIVPEYLANQNPRDTYNRYRSYAGR